MFILVIENLNTFSLSLPLSHICRVRYNVTWTPYKTLPLNFTLAVYLMKLVYKTSKLFFVIIFKLFEKRDL